MKQDHSGLKIVVISDTHLGTAIGSKWFKKRVKQIYELDPDIVLLLGDISEGYGGSESDNLSALNSITAPMRVWAVLGNHEFYGRRFNRQSLLEKSNIQLLRNKWIEIKPGLVIAGIDDPGRHFRGNNNDVYEQTLGKRLQGTTVFLFSNKLSVEF